MTDRPDDPPATLDDAVLEQLQALLKAGGPAFPFADPPGSRPTRIFPGMTIRDFFAAAALEGCVEKQFSDALLARLGSTEATSAAIAGAAYQIADACLLARRGGVDPLFGMIEQRDALKAQRDALLDAADFTLRCIEHPHPGPGERAADRIIAEEKLRVAIAFALGNKDAADALARKEPS